MPFIPGIDDIKRIRQIASVLAKHGFGFAVEYLNINDNIISRMLHQSADETIKMTMPERIFHVLSELGPTYIKLGQILSTRPDLLPEAYIKEFKKFQDNTACLTYDIIKKQIEDNLGTDIDNIFSEIDPKPLACASISQVHKGTLKDGQKIVIKVQRPDIADIIETDLDFLHFFARQIEKRKDDLLLKPTQIVKEFEKAIHQELDFTFEASNIDKFTRNFENHPGLVIPKLYREYSSKKILVMEFIDGVKVSDYKKIGANPKVIAELGISAIFKQLFEDGFFHADPHPGNLFVLKDNQIAFLDYGLMGRISEDHREKIVMLIAALGKENREDVANCLYNLCYKKERIDLAHFREDIDNLLIAVYDRPLKEIDLGRLLGDLSNIAQKYKMQIPSSFTMMIKSIITIESTAKEVYPELDIVSDLKPFIVRLMWLKWNPNKLSQDIYKNLSQAADLFQDMPIHIMEIVQDIRRGELTFNIKDKEKKSFYKLLDVASLRLTFGLVISALIVGSSIILKTQQTGFFGLKTIGFMGFSLAGILGVWLLISILKTGKLK
ncbi:MAG: lipopolysaccharide core heptose(II) kinase RfaY [Pseudomonadota bacterium]